MADEEIDLSGVELVTLQAEIRRRLHPGRDDSPTKEDMPIESVLTVEDADALVCEACRRLGWEILGRYPGDVPAEWRRHSFQENLVAWFVRVMSTDNLTWIDTEFAIERRELVSRKFFPVTCLQHRMLAAVKSVADKALHGMSDLEQSEFKRLEEAGG